MRLLLFISLCFLTSTLCQGQTVEQSIAAIANGIFPEEGPGGVVLAVKEGKTVYRTAFGKANLELGVNMDPGYIFRIGSITKQFTACAILQLAEAGKLSLQDNITKYLPDYPVNGRIITIEHLLTHTSGIKDYTGLPTFNTILKRTDLSPKALIDVFKDAPIDFEPGTQFRYCNAGYVLLGYIIEVVSGKLYAVYITDNFFKPLGMQHSSYDNTTTLVPGRIPGYQRKNGQYENADYLSMTLPYAAGSLLSTADDLYTWCNALVNNKVIKAESLAKAYTSYRLTNGQLTGYGYGWFLGNIQGSKAVRHVGKVNGFLTAELFIPEEKTFVAVFSNCENAGDLEYPAARIAAILLGKPYPEHPIDLPGAVLQSYQGVYSLDERSKKVIRYENGQLLYFYPGGSKTKLLPLGNDKFLLDHSVTTLEFEKKADGAVLSFQQKSTGYPETWRFMEKGAGAVQKIALDSMTLEKYVGRYEFPSGMIFQIVRAQDHLYGQVGHDKKEILPYDSNKFFAKEIDARIVFDVDAQGHVTGLKKLQNGEMQAKRVQ